MITIPCTIQVADHVMVCFQYASLMTFWTCALNRLSQPLVKNCHFGVSPLNYSDSDCPFKLQFGESGVRRNDDPAIQWPNPALFGLLLGRIEVQLTFLLLSRILSSVVGHSRDLYLSQVVVSAKSSSLRYRSSKLLTVMIH